MICRKAQLVLTTTAASSVFVRIDRALLVALQEDHHPINHPWNRQGGEQGQGRSDLLVCSRSLNDLDVTVNYAPSCIRFVLSLPIRSVGASRKLWSSTGNGFSSCELSAQLGGLSGPEDTGIFQISLQYSRIVRSDENLPERAELRRDMRLQCFASA